MNRGICLAGALVAGLCTSATAQIYVPAQTVVVPAQPGTVVTAPPVVAVPAPSTAYVPATLQTTAVQPAPFAPAPPGTIIETTADRRVVSRVDGYEVEYNIGGRREISQALVTEGIDGRLTSDELLYFWPLEVGRSVTFNVEGGGARAVTLYVPRTETITVPAGTFYTYVIEREDRMIADPSSRDIARMWYAPSVGSIVKYEELRGRAGRPAVNYDVVSMRLPYAPPGAALSQVPTVAPPVGVVRRPDTLENQAQFCRERGTIVRLSDGRLMTLDCATYVQTERAAYEYWLSR
jgi:hypothetical protein